MISTSAKLELLDALAANGGMAAALEFLNVRVPHRYTGIYRRDGVQMRPVCVYDKQTQELLEADAPSPYPGFPLSFCHMVQPGHSFFTADSATDARLAAHRFRGLVTAYFGTAISPAPEQMPEQMPGTVCHFDVAPHALDCSERCFLELAVPLLLRHLAAVPAWTDERVAELQ